MILAINGATTEPCPLEEDIRIAGECGYQAIEIRMNKLEKYLQESGLVDLKRLMDRAGVRPWSVNAIGMATLRDARGTAQVEREAERFAELAAALECPWILACPGPKPEDASWDEILTRSAADIARLADVAWRRGVFLGFDGVVSVEIFNHEHNRMDQLSVAQQAFSAVKAFIG